MEPDMAPLVHHNSLRYWPIDGDGKLEKCTIGNFFSPTFMEAK
jgi:hypothetical protein